MGLVMLDWNYIDNEKTFQRLVNHLFALECNSPGFIPSSPYIGADGGWDGRFDGTFPPGDSLSGIWCIESKWTKQTGQSAVQHLRREVTKTLRKAQANKVQHLRLATNAELRADQVTALQALNQGHVETFEIWHRENLATRINFQPFLRMFFFGLSQLPKFVPASCYFPEVEKRLCADLGDISSLKATLDSALAFVRDEESQILCIMSRGGMGKSHLLRQIAERAHVQNSARQLWVMRSGLRDVKDAVQEELRADSSYVLLVDDGDRILDEVEPLLQFMRHSAGRIKLILAFRSAGQFAIDALLTEARCKTTSVACEIASWNLEDLVRLLRHSAGLPKVQQEDIITAAYRNPAIIAWIGRTLQKRSAADVNNLTQRLLEDVEHDARRCLAEMQQPINAKVLLLHLACVVPCSTSDLTARLVQTTCGLDPKSFEQACTALKTGGILRTVGGRLRFAPDVKGDLILARGLETPNVDEELLRTYLAAGNQGFLVNVEAALRFAEAQKVRKSIGSLVSSWVQEASSTSIEERATRMRSAQHLCSIAPEECLDLLSEYLGQEDVFPRTSERHLHDSLSVSRDVYGPVILQLAHNRKMRPGLARAVEVLARKNIPGFFDTYSVATLARELVSPIRNGLDIIRETLETMGQWLQQPDEHRLAILTESLSELLGRSHVSTESILKGLTISSRSLRNTPPVRALRDDSLQMLRQMFGHSSPWVQLAALRVVERHGRSDHGPPVGGPVPLDGKIRREKRMLVQWVGELMLATAHLRVRSEAETILLHWWASNSSVANCAAGYLARLKRPAEYVFLRSLIERDGVVVDFDSLREKAPTDDRWKWYVDEVIDLQLHHLVERTAPIVQSLLIKYDTPERIVQLLKDIVRFVEARDWVPRSVIVEQWVKLNPKPFRLLRVDPNLWVEVPQCFRQDIDLALSYGEPAHVEALAGSLLAHAGNASEEELGILLSALQVPSLDLDRTLCWLLELVAKGTHETRCIIASRAGFVLARPEDAGKLVTLLYDIVQREPALDDFLRHFWLATHDLNVANPSIPQELLRQLRQLICERLRHVEEFDHDADELAAFATEDIAQICALLEERLVEADRRWREHATGKSLTTRFFHPPRSVMRHLHDGTAVAVFLDWFTTMRRRDLPFVRHELETLAEAIFSEERTQGNPMIPLLLEYIQQKSQTRATENALTACRFLPLAPEYADVILKVVTETYHEKGHEEAGSLLWHMTHSGSGWLCRDDGDSPGLKVRKAALETMIAKSEPGVLRDVVRGCLKDLEQEARSFNSHDEEYMNPRA